MGDLTEELSGVVSTGQRPLTKCPSDSTIVVSSHTKRKYNVERYNSHRQLRRLCVCGQDSGSQEPSAVRHFHATGPTKQKLGKTKSCMLRDFNSCQLESQLRRDHHQAIGLSRRNAIKRRSRPQKYAPSAPIKDRQFTLRGNDTLLPARLSKSQSYAMRESSTKKTRIRRHSQHDDLPTQTVQKCSHHVYNNKHAKSGPKRQTTKKENDLTIDNYYCTDSFLEQPKVILADNVFLRRRWSMCMNPDRTPVAPVAPVAPDGMNWVVYGYL